MKTAEPAFSTLPQAWPVKNLIKTITALLPELHVLQDGSQRAYYLVQNVIGAVHAFDDCITESWSVNDVPCALDGNDEPIEDVDEIDDGDEGVFVFTRHERLDILYDIFRNDSRASEARQESIAEAARHARKHRRHFVRVYYAMPGPSGRNDEDAEDRTIGTALVPLDLVLSEGAQAALVRHMGQSLASARVVDCDTALTMDAAGEYFDRTVA